MGRRGPQPKPLEEKKRLGNLGKKGPLPNPITIIKPVEAAVAKAEGPQTGAELFDALMAAGAGSWIGESDALALLRMVTDAWDERATLREVIAEKGYTQPDYKKGTDVARPEVAMLRELERNLTSWLAQLGLNPAARGQLGLAQVQAKATGLAALREAAALKAGRRAG